MLYIFQDVNISLIIDVGFPSVSNFIIPGHLYFSSTEVPAWISNCTHYLRLMRLFHHALTSTADWFNRYRSFPECAIDDKSSMAQLMAYCRTSHHLNQLWSSTLTHTVYPNKYAHGFVVLCFVVVMQSFIMNSYAGFIHIQQGCFAGTGTIVRLPQCQWSKPDGYGKISQCITTAKHSKAKTVCIFLGIHCIDVTRS